MLNRFTYILLLIASCSTLADVKTTEQIGTGLAIIIPVSAYGTTLYMADYDGQVQFYKSIAASTVTTFVLKYSVKRERPDGSDALSFPSAHTMFAFQGAAFIHQRYGFTYAIPAYLGAAFVGYSRIEADKHYLSDVLAGAAIGGLSSWFFTDRYTDVKIQPMAKKGSYGLSVTYRW